MFDIFVDMHQYKKIGEAQSKAQSASDKVDSVNDYIKRLETQIDEQKLIIQALAEILVIKGVISKDDLLEKIKEVDVRDGRVDGKIGSNSNSKCDSCGRSYNVRINKCQYCGHENNTAATLSIDYKKTIR